MAVRIRNAGIGEFKSVAAAVILLVMVAGCARAVKPQSATDTPGDHYATGLQLLEKNDVAKAREHFERAMSLDKRSPFGHTGMAFLELARARYDAALDHAKKAMDRDSAFADAVVVRGRILTVRKRGATWYEDSRRFLDRALELAPDDQRVRYYLGECCLKARRYDEAAEWFGKAAEVDGAFAEESRVKTALVRALIDVAPVSETGGQVALSAAVDRADFAAVLLDEFGLKKRLKSHRPVVYNLVYEDGGALRALSVKPRDVDAHAAHDAIVEIIPYAIADLSLFPNGFFYPDKLMTRAQAAVVFQAIRVLLTNDDTLTTHYIGAPSPFVDVRGDYYAYNAIMTCVHEAVLSVDAASRRFSPDGTVSGVEAIRMVRELERLVGD